MARLFRVPRGSEAIGLLLALSLLPAALRADVVHLDNGDRLTGEVKRIWDGELFVETPYADEFAIELDAVLRIESERNFEIELRDRTEVTGRLRADPAGEMLLVTEDGTRRLTLTEIEELEEPEEYFDWSVRSDLSLVATRGNTDTTTSLFQANGNLKIGKHRHRANVRTDQQQESGNVTKEQFRAGYSYSWFLSDRWFLAAGIGYERDPIRELAARYTPGAGMGYQIYDQARRELEVEFGAVGIREELAGTIEESLAARWALRYRQDLFGGDLELFHNHGLSVYLTGRSNTIVDSSTGIRWDVWGDVYMNMQLDYGWESEPALGAQPEDITYSLGLGLEFD